MRQVRRLVALGGPPLQKALSLAERAPRRSCANLRLACGLGCAAALGAVRQVLFLEPGAARAAADPAARRERALRMQLLGVFVTVSAFVIVLRLYSLQGTEHGKWNRIAARQHVTKISVGGARGTVLDGAGRALAVSVPALAVGGHPAEIGDLQAAAEKLAPLLGVEQAELLSKLQSKRPFVWLARGLPRLAEKQIEKVGLQGIATIPEFRRYYPQGSLAGPLLGRISRDGEGQSGLEHFFDERLASAAYSRPVRRDARGRYLTASAWDESSAPSIVGALTRVFAPESMELPLTEASRLPEAIRNEGADIVLSIDSVVQSIVERELEQGRVDAQAARAFGLVMDADTGEVLSLAQTNGFDPNRLENVRPEDMRNVIAQDSFEPGSTLKPLVAAAALDAKVVGKNEVLDCENGRYKVGRHTIRDVHGVGAATLAQVLIRSSNICMAKLGQRLGRERLHGALEAFGFGTPSGIELRGEAEGILRKASAWKPIDVATHSFGQGVSVTALQLVRAYAALANGGKLVRPTLLKRDKELPPPAVQVLRPETAAHIAEYLRGVTEDEHGTGQRAKINGLSVSGKTGTAQKARKDGRGYDPDRVLSSFIGFIDGREVGLDHRLVMLVAVDEPQVRPRWGGTVAGPIFRRSMERILSHLMASEAGLRTAAAPRSAADLG